LTRKAQFTQKGIRHATINGHRFHLRLTDPIDKNFLWINGRSPPLVLDQVAADFVGHLIDAMWEFQQGKGDESDKVRKQVVEKMYQQYKTSFAIGRARVTRKRIIQDLDRIFGTVMAVAEGSCPVEQGLEMEGTQIERWASPARMDLAVTYQCNLDCPHCYAGGPRDMESLPGEDWVRIFKKLWDAGIPQVVFTGGEPLLRDDLVDLVGEAEEFVTGLITNGVLLSEKAKPLQGASLDYLQVTLESHIPEVHNRMVGADKTDAFAKTREGILKALELGMEVVTNTTLTHDNANLFDGLLRFGKEMGLKSMACNALICSGRGRLAKERDSLTLEDLKGILRKAKESAQELEIDLQWYTPTCYHEFNPIELGLGMKACSAAAHNMTIQPDGTVLPCQSWPETVGNILEKTWEDIWNHPACIKLREHGYAKEKEACKACELLSMCGGGCPLEDIDKGEDL